MSKAFADHFSDRPADYAAQRPTYPEALFAFIASRAPTMDRAWDCATGNGQAAIGLARYFAHVDATDASAAQIAQAVSAPRVWYETMPAEKTDFAPKTFDAVCVAQAMHWFDIDAFHREVHRVMKPAGVFAAWGYDRLSVTPAFDVEFERLVLPPLKPHWSKENARLWSGYANAPFPYERIPAPPFAIEVQWTLRQLVGYVGTWSGTKRYIDAGHRGFLEGIEAALAPAWGNTETRVITMPLHFTCGRHAG